MRKQAVGGPGAAEQARPPVILPVRTDCFFKEHARRTLERNNRTRVRTTGLEKIRLEGTGCGVIRKNEGVAYAMVVKGLGRAFDVSSGGWAFGEPLLEELQEKTRVGGFIALGNGRWYGMRQEEVEAIAEKTKATTADEVILFAAPKRKAAVAAQVLRKMLREASRTSPPSKLE